MYWKVSISWLFLFNILALPIHGGIVLVGGGDDSKEVGTLAFNGEEDVIDMDPYPVQISGSVGGLLDENVPIVCGGLQYPATYSSDCHELDMSNGEWVEMASMTEARAYAASVNVGGTVWVTGGQNASGWSRSTEFYNEDTEEWTQGPELPVKLIKHSMAMLDNDTVLICGGSQWGYHEKASRRTWLFFWGNQTFQELTDSPLNLPRIAHSCASLTLFNGENTVVCVGGHSDSGYVGFSDPDNRKPEVFLDGKWVLKNQPIPSLDSRVIWGASLIPLHGRLLLLGGHSPNLGKLDTIFEYHEIFGFRKLSQRLDQKRGSFVGIALDDDSIEADILQYKEAAKLPNILIAGGVNEQGTFVSDVVNVWEDGEPEEFPNLPVTLSNAVGQIVDGRVIICGGATSTGQYSNKCYQLSEDGSEWEDGPSMSTERFGAASLVHNDELWVLGGGNLNYITKTTEFFSAYNSSWQTLETAMDKSLAEHCVVKISDQGEVMIIGGQQRENDIVASMKSRHVFTGSWLGDSWEEVDPINVKRFDHSCGNFRMSNGSDIVVVAGGQTGSNVASKIRHIETYNLESGEWTLMDQTVGGHFEVGIIDARTVESQDGNLFLLGGRDTLNTYYHDIYAYHELFGFYALETTLPRKLASMTVILLEDSESQPETTTVSPP